jgi:hypothetical protein
VAAISSPSTACRALTIVRGGGDARDFRLNVAPILNLAARPPPNSWRPRAFNAHVKSIRLGDIDVLNSGLHLQRASRPLEVVIGTTPAR